MKLIAVLAFVLLTAAQTLPQAQAQAQAQAIDPGPRPGSPTAGAGKPIAGLTNNQKQFWGQSQNVFRLEQTVSSGLGPAFNGTSCGICHSQPANGGSAPPVNPQVVTIAGEFGALNQIPSFLGITGPIREVRFVNNPDGTLDGGVHELFTIAGRTDAPIGCAIAQPDFSDTANLAFRIPTPTFGLGLVENTSDQSLLVNLAANAAAKASLGISGRFNRNGNDGTITRFGWKAQNKSLLLFAGEAANVELGLTNELFPNEKVTADNCQANLFPEDNTHVIIVDATLTDAQNASQVSSDIENFAVFMRLNAATIPCDFASPAGLCAMLSASAVNGQRVFNTVGCVLCHSDTLVTSASANAPLNNVAFQPFSDFALHDMGPGLADGISQGLATGSEFRTAPLWGVGQRVFFLHDGRTTDLVAAIEAHYDGQNKCIHGKSGKKGCGEADAVVQGFNGLSQSDQQDLVNFLRSL